MEVTIKIKTIDTKNFKELHEEHAVVILSQGKARLVELPEFGTLQIICKDNHVKRIKEEKDILFE